MGIIIKSTISNIFKKPLRTILVVFSIFVCSLAALFCFDLAKTESLLIRNLMSDMTGEADIGLTMDLGFNGILPEAMPENRTLRIRYFADSVYSDIEGEYCYVKKDDVDVYAVDPVTATSFGLLHDENLGDGEVIITDRLAEKLGYETGDIAVFHDKAEKPHEFVIKEIVKSDIKNLLLREVSAVVNDDSGDILSCGKPVGGMLMIDVLDNGRINEAEEILKRSYDPDKVSRYAVTDEVEQMMNELYGLLFVIFSIALLLVVFITFSICERIVGERMSYIGTLRSLGLSSRFTAIILLLENVFYALLGSIPGVCIYLSLRGPLCDAIFEVSDSAGLDYDLTVPDISKALILGVVLGSVLIECLIPLKAVIKALKTSIRDIIFDNRDTEYKFSKGGIVTGIIMCIISAACFIPGKNLFLAGLCLIAAVIALALLYPLVLKLFTGFIRKIAGKRENGKLYLSSVEAMARKSTVGSGVLCATSVCMCILIFLIGTSMADMLNADTYDCDTVVTCNGMKKYFSFIEDLEGVDDLEYLYAASDYVTVGDEDLEKMAMIYGFPEGGFRLYKGFTGLPSEMNDGTVCIEKAWAERNGISIGDTLTLTFNSGGVFPIKKELKVVSYFKIAVTSLNKNNFIITENDYKSIYHDMPGNIMIRTDDPEGIRDTIDKYSIGFVSEVKTRQEMLEEEKKENASSNRVMVVIIIIATAMTCIGMITGQLIGFEGRKKECAVMISTSMSRKTLSGILLREMLITSFASVTFGTAVGLLLSGVLKRAADYSDSIVIYFNTPAYIILIMYVSMMIIFTFTALFPARNLKKMKLAEQLKYE